MVEPRGRPLFFEALVPPRAVATARLATAAAAEVVGDTAAAADAVTETMPVAAAGGYRVKRSQQRTRLGMTTCPSVACCSN